MKKKFILGQVVGFWNESISNLWFWNTFNDWITIVEGETYADCRKEIFQITEGKYSMDYPYEDYAHMIEEYNLKQVPLQPHR